jgi:hypothetical protein
MRKEAIYFTDEEHKKRLLSALEEIGCLANHGRYNSEYAAPLYILTSKESTWLKTHDYIEGDSIRFRAILDEVDFGGGYSVLINLAAHIFNSQFHVEPIEFLRLDPYNFEVAMSAIRIRRDGLFASQL